MTLLTYLLNLYGFHFHFGFPCFVFLITYPRIKWMYSHQRCVYMYMCLCTGQNSRIISLAATVRHLLYFSGLRGGLSTLFVQIAKHFIFICVIFFSCKAMCDIYFSWHNVPKKIIPRYFCSLHGNEWLLKSNYEIKRVNISVFKLFLLSAFFFSNYNQIVLFKSFL